MRRTSTNWSSDKKTPSKTHTKSGVINLKSPINVNEKVVVKLGSPRKSTVTSKKKSSVIAYTPPRTRSHKVLGDTKKSNQPSPSLYSPLKTKYRNAVASAEKYQEKNELCQLLRRKKDIMGSMSLYQNERDRKDQQLSELQKKELESSSASLYNLGKTCFLNATLQCLKVVSELRLELTK